MIKNYTSGVPPEKSILHIERALVSHGAKNIFKNYGSGRLIGFAFGIEINGKEVPFKIPARIDRVEKRLKETVKKPHKGTMKRIGEQAEKTAWKILADWVDIQMTLVDLDQVELMEVFLPYAYDAIKNQTLFDKVKNGTFKLLSEKN